jgi:F420-non-reducing hydrogenase small subunit
MSKAEEVFGKVYERDSVVFRQGDPGDSMYVIQSGAVEISQVQDNREVVIALLEKGDFFGEMALIDSQPRSSTVRAICRTRLLPLTRNSLLERLSHDPGVILHLLKALSERIAKTNRLLRSVIEGDETLLLAHGGDDEIWKASDPGEQQRKQHCVTGGVQQDEARKGFIDFARLNFDRYQVISFQEGEKIFFEGEPGDTLYFVTEGEVEIYQQSEKGKYLLAQLGPQQFFGEMALISDKPRAATAVANRSTRVIALKRTEFLERTKMEPELGLYVLQVMIRRLRQTLLAVSQPRESEDLARQVLPPLIRKDTPISFSFVSLSTCGGCTASVLQDQNELSALLSKTDIVYCPMLMDQGNLVEADVVLVDGVVRVKEDEEMVQEARRKSRFLVAWGTCAAFGGIPALANEYEVEDLIEGSYGMTEDPFAYYLGGTSRISVTAYQDDNLSMLRRAARVDDWVRVDFYLAGCPPPLELLNELVRELRGEEKRLRRQRRVCAECKRTRIMAPADCFWVSPKPEWKDKHCFSSQGAMCMGFVTRGGCGAPCVKGGLPCWGCRGPSDMVLKKMGDGNSAESIVLNQLVRACRLDEDHVRAVMNIVRKRANSMLGFYEHLQHTRSRLR